MCAPVALGVASFATGALGAIGQQRAASAQASAANAAATSNYKYQLKMRERSWDRERLVYNQKLKQFDDSVYNNTMAANRAYAAEQRRLNEVYAKAAFSQQSQLGKLLQSQGKLAAAGRAGKSVDRVTDSAIAQYGRNQAITQQSLMSAQVKSKNQNEAIRRELISSNNQAFSQVAIAPQPGVAPPAPVMQSGPSSISLLSALGQSALGGYQAYNDAYRYEPQI